MYHITTIQSDLINIFQSQFFTVNILILACPYLINTHFFEKNYEF